MTNSSLFVILIAIVTIEAAAQYFAKKSYVSKEQKYLFYAFVLYGTTAILLYKSYRYSSMGLVNVMWNGLSTVTIILVGMYFFDERLNKYDYIGIVLTLVGIYLIYEKGHTSEMT